MKLFAPVLFRGDHAASQPALLDEQHPGPIIAAHTGHFAFHERDDSGRHLLVRDLLGVHKLFFALRDGDVESSNYLVDLLRNGHPFERVFSVPSGHYVRLDLGQRRYELVRWGQLRFGAEPVGGAPEPILAEFAAAIRAALEGTLRRLAKRCAGRPVYLALSGGLDSTTIAVLAREHMTDLHAVTFALRAAREDAPGSDLFFARRVAAGLGLAHIEVRTEPEEAVALLDEVLVHGQDYRDFNVYCGLVNAALGQAIGALHPVGPRPVILTGDVMNELLADYAPVRFEGREYFGLPLLERGAIRRFLVGGLDSGDREVGIFARFGVETVQPYALCAREYAALPSELACRADSKSKLVRAVMGELVPEYVLARPKIRAQVAVPGEPGGTLALLVSRGMGQDYLKQRFGELLGIDRHSITQLTRAGYYRFSTRFPEPAASGVGV